MSIAVDNNLLYLDFIMLGVTLDLIYEAVNFIRRIINNRYFTFVTDALTVLIFGTVSFFWFCAYTVGRLRGLLFLREAAGFLAVRLTLGSLCGVFYRICFEDLVKKLKIFLRKVKKIIENLLKKLNKMLYNIMEKKKKEVVDNAGTQKRKEKKKKRRKTSVSGADFRVPDLLSDNDSQAVDTGLSGKGRA